MRRHNSTRSGWAVYHSGGLTRKHVSDNLWSILAPTSRGEEKVANMVPLVPAHPTQTLAFIEDVLISSSLSIPTSMSLAFSFPFFYICLLTTYSMLGTMRENGNRKVNRTPSVPHRDFQFWAFYRIKHSQAQASVLKKITSTIYLCWHYGIIPMVCHCLELMAKLPYGLWPLSDTVSTSVTHTAFNTQYQTGKDLNASFWVQSSAVHLFLIFSSSAF